MAKPHTHIHTHTYACTIFQIHHLQHSAPLLTNRPLNFQMITQPTDIIDAPEAFGFAFGIGSCGDNVSWCISLTYTHTHIYISLPLQRKEKNKPTEKSRQVGERKWAERRRETERRTHKPRESKRALIKCPHGPFRKQLLHLLALGSLHHILCLHLTAQHRRQQRAQVLRLLGLVVRGPEVLPDEVHGGIEFVWVR